MTSTLFWSSACAVARMAAPVIDANQESSGNFVVFLSQQERSSRLHADLKFSQDRLEAMKKTNKTLLARSKADPNADLYFGLQRGLDANYTRSILLANKALSLELDVERAIVEYECRRNREEVSYKQSLNEASTTFSESLAELRRMHHVLDAHSDLLEEVKNLEIAVTDEARAHSLRSLESDRAFVKEVSLNMSEGLFDTRRARREILKSAAGLKESKPYEVLERQKSLCEILSRGNKDSDLLLARCSRASNTQKLLQRELELLHNQGEGITHRIKKYEKLNAKSSPLVSSESTMFPRSGNFAPGITAESVRKVRNRIEKKAGQAAIMASSSLDIFRMLTEAIRLLAVNCRSVGSCASDWNKVRSVPELRQELSEEDLAAFVAFLISDLHKSREALDVHSIRRADLPSVLFPSIEPLVSGSILKRNRPARGTRGGPE